MTSVNVTTQSNTVTVQQGDATTVTIATQGPQGPAGAGLSDVVNDTSPQLGGDLASNSFDIKFADNDKALFGADSDLQIFHDGTQSVIKENGTGQLLISGENTIALTNAPGTENYARFSKNGSVELFFDNVKRVETSADGVNLPDNSKLQLGDSQDLQIFHDGTKSVILDNGTGGLALRGENTISMGDPSGNRVYLQAIKNGKVSLRHNNVERLETTSSGVTVTGSVTTQDMNMSNLNGTANEVDNTKGSWSIQEGADDLFLINRVSGKKYKFNLTEVS